LPAHPEVAGALRRLTSAGFRLFTLTDNPASVQERQRKSAGIDQFFERCFSVENVRRYKPAPETYGFVQKELGQSPSQFLMVACHTWDTLGAVAAGWRAALIARPGNALLAVGPQPTFVANDLNEVADQLIERF
jgi:2-haloacid dehalogenase